jgi:serine/threonine protein kinase
MADDLSPTVNCNRSGWQDPRGQARMLVEEIVQRWHVGEEPQADKYFHLHPELGQYADVAVQLIYEEACLRRENGDDRAFDEILERYPQWRSELEIMRRCYQLLEDQPPEPVWPAIGETLGEFHLEAELGRGGLGRVYLASQLGLANRPVVLKITGRAGHEHLCLARVQHTHIVPLYAAHEDATRNLRILCMPYFGGATLSRVLEFLGPIAPARRTGADLLAALDRAQAGLPIVAHPGGSARKMLPGLTYVQAVCWIGACLADALHYAHERGLVHLDVKPSNVLLAADGEPMLLDFNVAQGPVRSGGPPPEGMGGTPLYMPPEQAAALQAFKEGRPAPQSVDARADVYALGRLLYVALGGPDPGEVSRPPALAQVNPQVSPGLADILARCMAPAAEARYPDAGRLAADLRRHNLNQPLQGVANRSLAERWRKWRRRRPQALRRAVLLAAVLGAVAIFAWREIDQRHQQRQEAEAALARGIRELHGGSAAQAVEDLQRGLVMAEGLAGERELTQQLSAELTRAKRAVAEKALHKVANRLRFLYGETTLPARSAESLLSHWQALWERRAWLLDAGGPIRDTEADKRLNVDLLDIGIIGADLLVRVAGPGEVNQARRQAMQVLDQAEALFGPSAALYRQRQALAQALGLKDEAREASRRAAALTQQSAWDHFALGRALLREGRLREAAMALAKAQDLEPQEFWPSFYLGVCAFRRGRYQEAVGAFRVCLALAPASAEVYYNRGLARAALGDDQAALQDYTRALTLNPDLGAAALNRGLVNLRNKNYPAARADFAAALRGGCDRATVNFNLALLHLACHDRTAALASVEKALQANPRHEGATRLRAEVGSASSSAEASKSRPGLRH